MSFTPTVEQQAIFDALANVDSGNILVRARAGTGKTTTILQGLSHAPEAITGRVLLAAFNKSIATELGAKVRRMGLADNVECSTLHSLGNRLIREALPRRQMAQGAGFDLCRSEAERRWGAALPPPRRVGDSPVPAWLAKSVAKIMSWGKLTMIRDRDILARAAYEQGFFPDLERVPGDLTLTEDDLVDLAWHCLRLTQRYKRFDFDDMVALPWMCSLRPGPTHVYDLIIIDEAQDMNSAQLALALRCLRPATPADPETGAPAIPAGRVLVVGDDRQAIYAFMGADSTALDRLKAELHATELTLTTTFRCPSRVVDAAATLVPDYRAADTAPEGDVALLDQGAMIETAVPGDFVIGRTNTAVIGACLSMIGLGKAATVMGRDIGRALAGRVQDLANKKPRVRRVDAVLARLATWLKNETARLEERGLDDAAAIRRDEAAAIETLCSGLGDVEEVLGRIEQLFSDGSTKGRVICMTTHKSKGLEAERIFVLAESYARGGNPNLDYVAITRAKQALFFVGSRTGHMEKLMDAARINEGEAPSPPPPAAAKAMPIRRKRGQLERNLETVADRQLGLFSTAMAGGV